MTSEASMADGPNNPDAKAFAEMIEETERQVAEYSGFLKKLKMRLLRTKKALASKPAMASQIAALVNDLNAMRVEPGRPSVPQLIDSLEGQFRALHRRFQDDFPSELRHGCERAELDFKPLASGYGVGPFFAGIDAQKQTALLEYAKVTILKELPLNVSSLVSQAAALKTILLDPPVDLPQFSSELHEAMRVAVARREVTPPITDLRVELPVVFRELGFIRQVVSGSSRKKSAGLEYSLSRFVIVLKQFLQSDDNLHADRQFRLEPAVIENTKNPKKSVFIPRDVSCGFGEGSYYQAILLQQK
jgi:hypothetical protein